MYAIASIRGLLNNMSQQFVICLQTYTITVIVCKHSYQNMFAHIRVLCFMNVCLKQTHAAINIFYEHTISRLPVGVSFHNGLACWGLHLSSDTALVILCRHCSFKRWPAATSFHNGPACWGLHLSSDTARHSVPAL